MSWKQLPGTIGQAIPRPARLTRMITSDKRVLCKLSGLKSLDFFDTLQLPPKTPGNRPLQAPQLAAFHPLGHTENGRLSDTRKASHRKPRSGGCFLFVQIRGI